MDIQKEDFWEKFHISEMAIRKQVYINEKIFKHIMSI